MTRHPNRCIIAAILCCIFWSFHDKVNGKILRSSSDQEAATGADVTFLCAIYSELSHPIRWYHEPARFSSDTSKVPLELYENGIYFDRCEEGRCSVSEVDGKLFVRNVTLDDAGRFTCKDRDLEVGLTAELVVFESYPSYESCNIKQLSEPSSSMNSERSLRWNFACSIIYRGNLKPRMEWRQNGSATLLNSIDTTISSLGMFRSSIQLDADEFNAHSYICQVVYSSSNLTSKYRWSTMVAFHNRSGGTIISTTLFQTPDDQSKLQPISKVLIALLVIASIVIVILGVRLYCVEKRRRRNDNHTTSEQQRLMTPMENDPEQRNSVSRKNQRKAILGLCVLKDELYVLFMYSTKIDVLKLDVSKFKFDRPSPENKTNKCKRLEMTTSDFEVKTSIEIEELENPHDMVCCSATNYIFICDWKLSDEPDEIYRIAENGRRIQWTIKGDKNRLSVTHVGNVLASDNWSGKIREYKPDGGEPVREISVNEIRHMWHAIELGNGKFAVSSGDAEDEVHGIYMISADGKIKKSCIDENSLGIGAMLSPRSLALGDDKFIYVADLHQGRIIMFTPDLEMAESIATNLQRPTRICPYKTKDNDNKCLDLLFVTDNKKENSNTWADGKILVVKIE